MTSSGVASGWTHSKGSMPSKPKKVRRQAPKAVAPHLTRSELRAALQIWPIVMSEATDEWAKEFAFSIWNQSAEPGWLPSPKQSRVIRKMCRETKVPDNRTKSGSGKK